MLAGYWAGVPSLAEHSRWVPRRLWRRYAPLPLPHELVRSAPWTPALRRLGDRLPPALARQVDFLACRLFDRWAAFHLASSEADAIIACEISALATFRAARRRGMTTLLDAPSIHHLAQDRMQPTLDPPGLHRRLAAVKDAEIALADHVLTVSQLARDSYLQAGVAPARVHALPLGADPALFAAVEGPELEPRDERSFVFLFAGASIRRKGFDLLLAAFEKVIEASPSARLRVFGPAGDVPLSQLEARGVEVGGPLAQAELARELRRADCLVLPSRHDSYGMVVVESLASGTPVLVSEMVGAKDLVAEGRNGWIVPVGDSAALASRMFWCVDNARTVRGMRAAARRSVAGATWEAYHHRLVTLLKGLASGPSPVVGDTAAARQDALA
ncbi:MAG TPA: glycosyltransferase family 4 protein [Thermoanaerobaculia bacterium]|jgi:glycosyltransferase involved in cell wall biosynthesis|nr:glycosyltransferase family 4 protein [Thermoanaerobaculia bacterium]